LIRTNLLARIPIAGDGADTLEQGNGLRQVPPLIGELRDRRRKPDESEVAAIHPAADFTPYHPGSARTGVVDDLDWHPCTEATAIKASASTIPDKGPIELT